LGKFSDTFEGIGKMKGVKVDLNIDTDVKPVAQPLRRIPFSVRPKIEEELRRLQEEDIIEKIDKPTSWISPTVITPTSYPGFPCLKVLVHVEGPWQTLIARLPNNPKILEYLSTWPFIAMA
jgi:hypothetical protein